MSENAQKEYLAKKLTVDVPYYKVIFENGAVVEGDLEFNGESPENGQIIINGEGKIFFALHTGDYCTSKLFTEEEIVTSKKTKAECESLIPTSSIVLNGANTVELELGQVYTDLGFQAQDEFGNPITVAQIEVTKDGIVVPAVDVNTSGDYIVKYTVMGSVSQSEATRLVKIIKWECGDLLVDSRDGKSYTTVAIGTQCWMRENIRYTGSGCLKAHKTEAPFDSCSTHEYSGVTEILYQWHAAMNNNAVENGQGICPTGWSVPSDAKYKQLEIFLGMTHAQADLGNVWRGVDQGVKLRVISPTSFSAKPIGYRGSTGVMADIGSLGFWWSSTFSGNQAWSRLLSTTEGRLRRNSDFMNYGSSVRCVLN